MTDLDKLTQALDKVQASLDRIYKFLGCPRPSQDPEGFARWLREYKDREQESPYFDYDMVHGSTPESEPGSAAPSASDTGNDQPPKRWGEVYDGGQ